MRKSKIFMIGSIIIFVLAIVGFIGTYAWYYWSTSDDEKTQIVTNIGAATVYYDGGTSIEANLSPVATKEEGVIKTVSVKSSTSGLKFNLYLDITTLDDGLKDVSFRYQFYKASTLVKEGNFSSDYLSSNTTDCTVNTGVKHITLLSNESIGTTASSYTLYIWIDGANYTNPDSMQNKNYSFNLHAEGGDAVLREGIIPDITDYPEEQKDSLAYKILSDYYFAEKTNVFNNSVTYYYDTEHQLMSDVGGNVRYYGADGDNLKNYINFNCETYPDTNCETWRIIGVFDGKVKLIRNSVLGKYSWDYKYDGSTASYSNDWSKATLNTLLNDTYYKAGSTSYYNKSTTPTTVNFSSTGLKNDTTRNMISETLYYLGGWTSSSVYSDQIYEYERGTNKCSNCTYETRWPGKIALAYPSDYGYAADFGSCGQTLYSYNNSSCITVNWMKSILGTSSYGWLLTSSSTFHAWSVYSSCYVSRNNNVSTVYGVAPVLHLNSDVVIESGDGSSGNPYRLSVG